MNISRGKIQSALKVGIYGPEGVGKTTFASQFPGAVFIDTEGSTRHMDVARFDSPDELSDVINQINYVVGHPNEVGTLVIDTVDWLEKLLFDAVCAENKWKSIEEPGYGKGYVAARQKMQQLLAMLDQVIAVGVNVVLICHSFIRKFEQPDEMSSYDRYMLKLNEKNIAPLVKEWTDLLLFVNYKTDVVKVEKTNTVKGRGGQKRVMYATHTASWDAKNRFGLPDEMPFDFGQIAHLFNKVETVMAKPQQTMEDVLNTAPVDLHMDKPAEVTISDTLPAAANAKKGKKTSPPPERPESMKHDDPEKDRLLSDVWERMAKNAILDPMVIQAVCAERGYYDAAVPIRDYDMDFIEGCLIEAWDTVLGLALTKQHDLPF